MKQVIFVCSANTCRSPLGEYIFKQEAQEQGLTGWSASSAGLAAWEGEAMSDFSAQLLQENYPELDISSFRSKALHREDVAQAELILCMTEGHRSALLRALGPEEGAKVHSLIAYARGLEEGAEADIYDPYGGDIGVYAACFGQIRDCVRRIVRELKARA